MVEQSISVPAPEFYVRYKHTANNATYAGAVRLYEDSVFLEIQQMYSPVARSLRGYDNW